VALDNIIPALSGFAQYSDRNSLCGESGSYPASRNICLILALLSRHSRRNEGLRASLIGADPSLGRSLGCIVARFDRKCRGGKDAGTKWWR
jgi:hypothetical protein